MDLYNLSTPAYFYLLIAIFSNVLTLFILPFNCSSIALITCIIILIISIFISLILIYLVTWAIDTLYQSEYITLSWILSIVCVLFSLIDLGNTVNYISNDPGSSSSNVSSSDVSSSSNVSTSDHSSTSTKNNNDWVTGISESNNRGNTRTSGFTDSALDIYSNPVGSYIGK
jgi:hypothetical protein